VGGCVEKTTFTDCIGNVTEREHTRYYLTMGTSNAPIEISYNANSGHLTFSSNEIANNNNGQKAFSSNDSVSNDSVNSRRLTFVTFGSNEIINSGQEAFRSNDVDSIKIILMKLENGDRTSVVLDANIALHDLYKREVVFENIDVSQLHILHAKRVLNANILKELLESGIDNSEFNSELDKLTETFYCGYLHNLECGMPDLTSIDKNIKVFPNPSNSGDCVYIEIDGAITISDGWFEVYYLQENDVVHLNNINIQRGVNSYKIDSNIFEKEGIYYIVGRLFVENYFHTTNVFPIMRKNR
jgi:hypothetical protein